MREYDGIVCFGGADWWYHNRGHYDIQMCRQFADRMPVLYVNSIGVRTPSMSEGGMFLRRVLRKVNSWRRGYCEIDRNFAVLSPITIPGRIGRAVSNPILRYQIARATKRMGIDSPLLWVETPTAEPVLDSIEHAGIVYQRTDRYEEFDGVDRDAIEHHDRALKRRAAVTLYCSSYLYDLEEGDCQAAFVDHGVHFDRFEAAGISSVEPPSMAGLRRPRAGFVGGLDDHTFDVDLFLAVARALPDVEFVLVGGSSFPSGWCTLPNVVHVGQVDYEEVPGYMAACDVLIMPWRQNEWIRACNPVKLKEYLAVGRPVITTWFEELNHYEGLVRIAQSSEAFTSAILLALTDVEGPEAGRNRVRSETWAAKAALVETHLYAAGLEPRLSAVHPDTMKAGGRE